MDAKNSSRAAICVKASGKSLLSEKKRRGKETLISDNEILQRIKGLVAQRPSCGYRRACAVKKRALLRCWDRRRIEAMFVIDTCDREVLSLVAAIGTLEASDVRDALALAYERCFPSNEAPKTKIDWLTDNGGIFEVAPFPWTKL